MAQTPCDFFGYTACGRAILIEAKMVDRPSLPIRDRPGLEAHQWNELDDANRAGALALICWARRGIVKTFGMDMARALSVGSGRVSIAWGAIPDHLARPLSAVDRLRILDHWLPLETVSSRP